MHDSWLCVPVTRVEFQAHLTPPLPLSPPHTLNGPRSRPTLPDSSTPSQRGVSSPSQTSPAPPPYPGPRTSSLLTIRALDLLSRDGLVMTGRNVAALRALFNLAHR